MKRFWLVLLSLGLIAAFSTSAMAVDVKVSGEFYAAGAYLDKVNLVKNGSNSNTTSALYYQRLRLNTKFIVSPGLMLDVRADVMERAWGATRSASVTYSTATQSVSPAATDTLSAGTRAENENIVIDLVYLTYVSKIGIFKAGYQVDGAWGTVFGDNSVPTPRIDYTYVNGGLAVSVMAGKIAENSYSAINSTTAVDRDNNFYTAFVRYAWKAGEAGLLFKYFDIRSTRGPAPAPAYAAAYTNKGQYLATLPYAKVKLGPVALQTELVWIYGNTRKYEEGITADDLKKNSLAFWVDGVADFGMFYAGGTLAYLSGQDHNDTTKDSAASGGLDWNPCLIAFNADRTYWNGAPAGATGQMTNAYFAQIKGGVRPIDKLDIFASVSYGHAVNTPQQVWGSRDYGWEVDLTATYKITNNLSYMLGGGYLFTGGFAKNVAYQTTENSAEIQNDFLVLNKLTLTF